MPRLIAVDLGAHAVKVSTYRWQKGRLDPEERHRQRVPQDGEWPSLEQRCAALDALLDVRPALRAGGGDVVAFALSGELATFHRITMPFTDRSQVQKTLPFAVEAEVPFDLDEMVMGWRVLGVTNHTEVLTALVRHDRLEEWIRALADRGLDPALVFVDVELHGFWVEPPEPELLLEGEEPGPTPLHAVIDLGHAHTVVTVLRGGHVELCRAIDVGGLTFTRAIRDALGCSWEEAEALKHGDGKSGYAHLPEAARTRLDAAVGMLLAEVRSTLIKAEDALGGEVADLRLAGGSSRIHELWEYLAHDLGVPVRRVADPEGQRVGVGFELAHALAQHAAPRSAGEAIDLRIGDLQYRGGTDSLRAALTYGTAGLSFFVAAALVMFAWQWRTFSAEHRGAVDQIHELVTTTLPEVPPGAIEDPGVAVQVLQEYAGEAIQQAEFLGEGSGGLPPTVDLLYELTNAFPPHPDVKVEVSELTITRTTVTFNAETDGFSASSAVEEALQQHPRFRAASKGQETKLSNGRVKFPITIALDAPATGTDEPEIEPSEEG